MDTTGVPCGMQARTPKCPMRTHPLFFMLATIVRVKYLIFAQVSMYKAVGLTWPNNRYSIDSSSTTSFFTCRHSTRLFVYSFRALCTAASFYLCIFSAFPPPPPTWPYRQYSIEVTFRVDLSLFRSSSMPRFDLGTPAFSDECLMGCFP